MADLIQRTVSLDRQKTIQYALINTEVDNKNLLILKKALALKKHPNFLIEFRKLRDECPLIKQLTAPKNQFLYWFKTENSRTERYKNIIKQLKTELIDQPNSLFHDNQISFCAKVEQAKKEFLTKSYDDNDSHILQHDQNMYYQLNNFNQNCKYKAKIIINHQKSIEALWNKWIALKPQYAILNYNNENSEQIKNVEGKTCKSLKEKLGISDELFNEKNELSNAAIIKIQQKLEPTNLNNIKLKFNKFFIKHWQKINLNIIKDQSIPVVIKNEVSNYLQSIRSEDDKRIIIIKKNKLEKIILNNYGRKSKQLPIDLYALLQIEDSLVERTKRLQRAINEKLINNKNAAYYLKFYQDLETAPIKFYQRKMSNYS